MNKVLIDTFYHKVTNGTPLNEIPKPYQAEVHQLIDGIEEELKKNIEIPLARTVDNEVREAMQIMLGGE